MTNSSPSLEWAIGKRRVIVDEDYLHPMTITKAAKLYSTLTDSCIRSRRNRGENAEDAFYKPAHSGKQTEVEKRQKKKVKEQTTQERYIQCQQVTTMRWTNLKQL